MGAQHASQDDDKSPWWEEALARLPEETVTDSVQRVGERTLRIHWDQLPEKIILVRHGESEGNVNKYIYTAKGDAMLELTAKGLRQAEQAGAELKEIVGNDDIFVVASPFERVQQTLLGLYRGGFPEHQVRVVHVSPQIREQEFGNFQGVGVGEKANAEQKLVGRFYYRRDNGESSADVYDRVSAFWDELLRDTLPRRREHFHTCLMVTHGLTMRLLLMKVFSWSVETFETVFNAGNCEYITLVKDMGRQTYDHSAKLSKKQKLPWATKQIWVVKKERRASADTEEKLALLKKFRDLPMLSEASRAISIRGDLGLARNPCLPQNTGQWVEIERAINEMENKRMKERSEAYTVMDYLTVPQPRTEQRESLNGKLMPGHSKCVEADLVKGVHLDWEEVEFVDWWGETLSCKGKMLRKDEFDQRHLAALPPRRRSSHDHSKHMSELH